MNIQITQTGKNVYVTFYINCGWAGERSFQMEWNTNDPAYAGLLAESLEEQLTDHMERVRKNAYNLGWEDKTKRRKKRTFFGYVFKVLRLE